MTQDAQAEYLTATQELHQMQYQQVLALSGDLDVKVVSWWSVQQANAKVDAPKAHRLVFTNLLAESQCTQADSCFRHVCQYALQPDIRRP